MEKVPLTSPDCFHRTRLLRLKSFGHYRCEAFLADGTWSPHHRLRILPCSQDIEHCSLDSLWTRRVNIQLDPEDFLTTSKVNCLRFILPSSSNLKTNGP
jgi:hypothetical protein